jgi:hypothetical protein
MGRTALKERATNEIRERAVVAGQRARVVGEQVGHRLGESTKDTRRRVGHWIAGETPRSRRTGLWATLAAGIGAAAAFFLDPVSGKRRRHVAGSWIAGRFRRAGERAGRAGRGVGAQAYGAWQSATHLREAGPPENDITLAEKVSSEAFAGLEVPSRINVNAEDGVVYLRGQVDRPGQIKDIERRVRGVNGVRGVVNLLHLPGTPAPTT